MSGNSKIIKTYMLDAEGIDNCSAYLDAALEENGIESENRIRLRLSLEESLLRMRNRFGEGDSFSLIIENRLRRLTVSIEHEGEIYNPLSKTQAELEDWSGSLLTAVGLSPIYSYSKGKNILRVGFPKKRANPANVIIVSIIVGIILGFAMRYVTSPGVQDFFSNRILSPFFDLWVRILTLLSGPVIFLMVTTSVLNTGSIEEEGGKSWKIVLRYFLISMGAAVLAVIVSVVFSLKSFGLEGAMGTAGEYLETLFSIVPKDVVTPLAEGNTPQILFLAFVLGNMIIIIGARVSGLNAIIRQANMIGILLTDAASNLAPYFAGLLICMEVMRGNLDIFKEMWKIFLLSVAASAIILAFAAVYVSASEKVPMSVLMKKLWPSFKTAIVKGDIDAGFGQMEKRTIYKLGVEKEFATVSLPFGLILSMPMNVVGTLVFTVFAANRFGISITPRWLIIAMVLSVILFVATPPVPGANLLAYIMIFAQLGIPSDALISVLIFEMVFGIFASAANQMLLQMDLILQADKIGLLDKEVLRKKS